MDQDAGEKCLPHVDPDDPPRRRGNRATGHGTWGSDRPPFCGVVGRESGAVRLSVEEQSDGAPLNRVAETGCERAVVCHAAGECARDDDGDGVRKVHGNTMEGPWAGLWNLLRTFRGLNKEYLYQYIARTPVAGDASSEPKERAAEVATSGPKARASF